MELPKVSVVKTVIEREVTTSVYPLFKMVEQRERVKGKPWKITSKSVTSSFDKEFTPVIAGPLFEEQLKYWNPFYGDVRSDSTAKLMPPEIYESIKKGMDFQYLAHYKGALEEIDPKRVYFLKSYDHTARGPEGEIVPMVQLLNYIGSTFKSEFTGSRKRLEDMRNHLLKHPCVIGVTEIEEIPYYNNDSGDETYFSCLVRPTVKVMNDAHRAIAAKVVSHESPFLKLERLSYGNKEEIAKYGMDWLDIMQFKGKE